MYKPQNHLYTCHTTFLLSFIQFRALYFCHVFCGNGGHSEISKPQNYVSEKISGNFHPISSTMANQRWISIHNIIIYLEAKFRPNRRIFVFGGHLHLVTMATAASLNFVNPQKLPHTTVDIPTKWIIIWLPNHGYQFPTSKSTWKPNFAQIEGFLNFGGHFGFKMAAIANQRWISIRNIIIYGRHFELFQPLRATT